MSRLIPLWAVFRLNLSENAFLMKLFRRCWQSGGGTGRKKKLLVILRQSNRAMSINLSKYWKEPDAQTQSHHNETVVEWPAVQEKRRFWVYQAAVSLWAYNLTECGGRLGGVAVLSLIFHPPNLSKKAHPPRRISLVVNMQFGST